MRDLAIEFVNAPSRPAPDSAGIGRPEEMVSWLAERSPETTALLPSDAPGLRALHAEALALQRSLRMLLRGVTDGSEPDDPSRWLLDACLADLGQTESLAPMNGAHGPYDVEVCWVPRGPRAPLGIIARDAVRLLGTTPPHRLRLCAADDCDRWFVDSSKAGRRKWCSMATCGNRAKASRYRTRHLATG